VHERLSIVGIDTGAQPMLSEDGSIALAVSLTSLIGRSFPSPTSRFALRLRVDGESSCSMVFSLEILAVFLEPYHIA
jgi:hypothetical protein